MGDARRHLARCALATPIVAALAVAAPLAGCGGGDGDGQAFESALSHLRRAERGVCSGE